MQFHREASPKQIKPDQLQPTLVETRLGAVECAPFGEGPAVLCLHGAMGGYDQSAILALTLGGVGYRYLAVSRPGYLGTPISLGKSPEEQADLLAALLDSLGIERAAVMAVSGGGPPAIHFALRHRDRCFAMVLASTVAQPATNRLPLSFKVMKVLMRIPLFASSAMRRTREQPERVARRAITDDAVFERTVRNVEAWELLKALQLSTVDRMTRRFAGTENDVAVTRTRSYPLEQVAVPTLVVQGTRDPYVPFERHGKVLVERIPGAELIALEGGEHAAIFTHRDEARARVTEFLKRTSKSAIARRNGTA